MRSEGSSKSTCGGLQFLVMIQSPRGAWSRRDPRCRLLTRGQEGTLDWRRREFNHFLRVGEGGHRVCRLWR